ncbi:MAG: hypothetical protein WB586_08915 [Chthoniobacterales bacterium]
MDHSTIVSANRPGGSTYAAADGSQDLNDDPTEAFLSNVLEAQACCVHGAFR